MRVNVCLISRSNPSQVVMYDPKEKRSYTRLEDLREHPHMAFRRDIAVVNVDREGIDHRQFMVYASWDGEPYGDGIEWLNAKELGWLRTENRKLINVARRHPEFEYYLR